jgi:ubiquinone/menaquinone biosynthesis C-methylase UbiE/broad specificity phosphatase PhoE
MRLLLICQAEGLRNRYESLVGFEESDDNSGLTAVGWEQTNLLAAWLKSHERIDTLISGPQLRSRLTAQRVGQMLGLPVKVRSELPKYAPDALRTPGGVGDMPRMLGEQSGALPRNVAPDYEAFCTGVVAVVDQVLSEHWGKAVAMVLNGAALAVIARAFFGSQQLPMEVSHTGITEFVRRHGQWRCVYVNRREHLPSPVIAPGVAPASDTETGSTGIDLEEAARIVEVYNRLGARATNEQAELDRVQRMRDLVKFAHFPSESRLLDVGAGGGQLALLLAEDGAREVVGIDLSPVILEVAEYRRLTRKSTSASRVSFRQAAAQTLPFGDESFDGAVCRLVIDHTQRPDSILQEVARVLKVGGLFVLADLVGADDPVRRATQNAIEERRNPAYLATRTSDKYRAMLAAAGFTIESEKVAVFDRELEEWLTDMDADPANRAAVRDMMEAGIETDASGLHVRKQGTKLVFEQRMYYARAVRKA